MTVDELLESVAQDSAPPSNLSSGLRALWHAKKGNWEQSHDIAQEDHTAVGSWIHALLHLIEGDVGNANYWFHKAHKTPRKVAEIDAVWEEIAGQLLSEAAR